MLIDVQDTTRLSLGGTEERELIIMPEERSARAIAGQQWSCQEQEEANLHLRCESMSEEEGVEQAQREVCHKTRKRSIRKSYHLEKGLSRLGNGLRGGSHLLLPIQLDKRGENRDSGGGHL
ncbi:hypothetical protein RND71_043840 [Anisodus tanguticus]|uniref:Uncharacterized protein n=1 Tax=Anisodus tanguticus TaxID=243964 RepID=A0AAE1QQ50_9SOLA|nr:hypothetical protein RND71_043840 [Anisodus tanguticus]